MSGLGVRGAQVTGREVNSGGRGYGEQSYVVTSNKENTH